MTKTDLQTATLPATAFSVLLTGMATNHAQAGAVTWGLFLLVVLAFSLQLAPMLRRRAHV